MIYSYLKSNVKSCITAVFYETSKELLFLGELTGKECKTALSTPILPFIVHSGFKQKHTTPVGLAYSTINLLPKKDLSQ